MGRPPLSVDPVSAAWYRDNLPPSRTNGAVTNYNNNRTLNGPEIISAKLLDSLRNVDTLSARKPPKSALIEEYLKHPVASRTPRENDKTVPINFSTKAVTFTKPPNSDLYGSGQSSNSNRLPYMRSDTSPSITSSFPSRTNDVTNRSSNDVIAPYKLAADNLRNCYTSTYSTAYGTPSPRDDPRDVITTRSRVPSAAARDERRRNNNMLALKQREHSMYQAKDPAFGTDEYYLRKMEEIVCQPTPSLFPASPSKVTEFMYVGGYRDAENWMYLKRLGITHVLNTAAVRKSTYNPYPPESGVVGYESFDADDVEGYDVMQHYPRAKAFIDRCRWSNGKVLVHCAMGVNRSGTMCCAYLMSDQGMSLLEAVRHMKQRRYTSLCNRSFRRQLLRFARQKGYL